MTEGKLIAFEGIDGSGLTTQASMLRAWLRREGESALLTKEPSEGPVGALIRQIIRKQANGPEQQGDLDHYLALLFAADRLYHLSTLILPAVRSGTHVVTDRYFLSSLAYQGVTISMGWLTAMNARCRAADLTIYLHVPVEVCVERIHNERWHPDLYEERDKLQRVQKNFVYLAEHLAPAGYWIETVDGDQPPEVVHTSVLAAVRKMLSTGQAAEIGQPPFWADVIGPRT